MHPAAQVVTEFVAEMFKWETACDERSAAARAGTLDRAEEKRVCIAERKAICDRYLAAKFFDPDGYNYSKPPTNDPSRQPILSVTELTARTAEVKTPGEHPGDFYVFVLTKTAGVWRITKKWHEFANGTRLKAVGP